MNLIKISDKENRKIYWTKDDLDKLKLDYPDITLRARRNSNGIDTDELLPFITRGDGHGLQVLDNLSPDIKFYKSPSGVLDRYLNWYYEYTLEDFWCHLVFGDRNLRPIDPDTGNIPKFQGILKGYHTSSDRSSANKKVNRNFIWTPETWVRIE